MKAAVRTKTKKPDTGEFDRLCKQAIAARQTLREFEEEHQDVIDEHIELKNAIEGINERIKIEARKLAVLGETKVLVDNKDIHVSVQGKQTKTWDVAKAKKTWPTDAIKRAVKEVIDSRTVDALVETGVLDEESVDSVVSLEPATAAVSIRLP